MRNGQKLTRREIEARLLAQSVPADKDTSVTKENSNADLAQVGDSSLTPATKAQK